MVGAAEGIATPLCQGNLAVVVRCLDGGDEGSQVDWRAVLRGLGIRFRAGDGAIAGDGEGSPGPGYCVTLDQSIARKPDVAVRGDVAVIALDVCGDSRGIHRPVRHGEVRAREDGTRGQRGRNGKWIGGGRTE